MATAQGLNKKAPEPAPPGWRDELHLLARPAAVFLAVLALAVILLGTAIWYRAQQEDALGAAAVKRAVASNRFINVAQEKRDIADYQPRFLALQAAGLIGDENRLAWVETIRYSQASRKLASATYDIEAQQPVALAAPMALGDYQLRGSRMRFQLGMVHELDLFHFLDDLRNAGLFSVQDCKMKRLDVPAEAIGVARLQADCSLVWLSLAPAPAAAANARPGKRP